MSKYNDRFNKKLTLPDEAIAFALEVGFHPSKIEVVNLTNGAKMEWYKGMRDGAGFVSIPDAATAAVGTAAAGEDNAGAHQIPVAAGTYTGRGTGNLYLTCTTKGDLGAGKFKAEFPDGSVIEDITSGASGEAKTIGQGVTFSLTSNTPEKDEKHLEKGDLFTIPLVSKGVSHIVAEKGLGVDFCSVNKIKDGVVQAQTAHGAIAITVGLNTSVNVAKSEIIVSAE